jgi:integrase
VAVAREEETDIEIFTPAELTQLFQTAQEKPELIPFVAVAAFAGLRHAEITRLEWPEIRLEDGFIEVKARKAKTASRRLVPITPNLRAWLEKYHKVSGPIVQHERSTTRFAIPLSAIDSRKCRIPRRWRWKRGTRRKWYFSTIGNS